MKYFLLLSLLILSSCTTWTPAVGGKLTYEAKFEDITDTQTTTYNVKLSGPAGVELAGMAQMHYTLNEEGTYDITVAQEGVSDSTKQATLIEGVNQAQLDAIVEGMKIGAQLAPVFESIMSQKIQAKQEVADRAIDSARVILENNDEAAVTGSSR